MTFSTLYPSPIGTLLLTSDGKALTGLIPTNENCDAGPCDPPEVINKACRWLDGYFTGNPAAVDFPISPAGTDFQLRVWDLLQAIPYGKTVTYGQLAQQLDEKMSPQAVGQAVGKNPIAILIPCHRVVGSRGQLTGYAWGIEKKTWLLAHEEESK